MKPRLGGFFGFWVSYTIIWIEFMVLWNFHAADLEPNGILVARSQEGYPFNGFLSLRGRGITMYSAVLY